MSEQLPGRISPAMRANQRRMTIAAGVAILLASVACFPARTVLRDDLRTAWPIQIQYERPTSVLVTSPVGTARTVERVTEVRGVLTTLDGDSAIVTAATVTADQRTVALRADEAVHVSIAASEIERMRQERFSGKRTLGAAGITVGFVLLVLTVAVVLVIREVD